LVREALYDTVIGAGLACVDEVLEAERVVLCGERYEHLADRQALRAGLELTRFRRRCWGERKKEVPNAKNPSTIRAGVSAPNHRVGAHGAPDCAVGP
jgi:hypothetical protein